MRYVDDFAVELLLAMSVYVACDLQLDLFVVIPKHSFGGAWLEGLTARAALKTGSACGRLYCTNSRTSGGEERPQNKRS
jgi:hypothetical protein